MAKAVGFIGGTGPEGKGLAARFAKAGLDVFIGSRAAERGAAAAREIAAAAGTAVRGGTNAEAAGAGEIVAVTVPFAGLEEALAPLAAALRGRIVVSTVAPLRFASGKVSMIDVEAGSAAQETQRLLPGARVIGAFQNLSAHKLFDLSQPVEGDVIVCSDDAAARAEVMALAEVIPGIRGVNGGALSNSRFVEGITALLVSVNRIYKAEAHIRVVGG